MVAIGDGTLQVMEPAMLEEQNRVVVEDAGEEQPLFNERSKQGILSQE